LSKSLQSNETLQVLDLSFCRMGMSTLPPKNQLDQKEESSIKKGAKKEAKKEKKGEKSKNSKKKKDPEKYVSPSKMYQS
jgi:hypothetical protein